MDKKFQVFPESVFHSIEELEKLLQFRYLPHNVFESAEEEKEIQEKGYEKSNLGQVSSEAEELGKRMIGKIKGGEIPDVSIRWIDEKVGHGLFVEEELSIGDYAGEYTGVVRKNDIRRYLGPLNNYCYEYPVPDDLGRSYVIDATQGHLTRFINHSFTPNLRSVHVFYEGFFHLIFLPIMPIAKGEQLTFSYGTNYWYLRRPPQVL